MAKNTKIWHPKFMKYMEDIINHPNYEGLEITKDDSGAYKWVSTAKSDVGKKRIGWCIEKARQLKLISETESPYPGMFADVMRVIHPRKWKVCQICGEQMSIYYHYPNESLIKKLEEKYQVKFTQCDHISIVWDRLKQNGITDVDIVDFFKQECGFDIPSEIKDKDSVIDILEHICRKGQKKYLGPGAMSDFPDRFDGFHTYNRCCRAEQDKGRSKENLKSYTKDRRAYEYWSDGNIHAANQFMGTDFFKGISADHIGPISLGFIHDPLYLQPMLSGDNSAKRDRLQVEDIEKIISIESTTGVCAMSWQSQLIWEHIKNNYCNNVEKVSSVYREALKQNMANYMFVLQMILDDCHIYGKEFLIRFLLAPKYENFKYTYLFSHTGNIVKKMERNFTERISGEFERFVRIAIQAVYDYFDKENRQSKPDLVSNEMILLHNLCRHIEGNTDYEDNKNDMITLITKIEERIVNSL